MASIISAGTTSGTALNFTGDTSGNLAFQTQAGANTITIANQTGTLNAAGPAFSAYQSTGSASLGANTRTKIALQTEEFDTNSNFDSTTNYRFTPTIAGYYQVNGSITANGSTELVALIYKNGTLYKAGSDIAVSTNYASVVSSVLYLNGSTDYIELYAFTASATTTFAGISATYLNGFLVRGA